MKRRTKARLSTVVGCALGGITFTAPLAGQLTAQWQCNHGLCPHEWHRHRYQARRR